MRSNALFSRPVEIKPFIYFHVLSCHSTMIINVIYTNMAKHVDAWIAEIEVKLDASVKPKIVGVDVEYTKKVHYRQTAAVLQLCVGEEVLVYHYERGDEEPERLPSFLANWEYIFAGFDISNDINVLCCSTAQLLTSYFIQC